jgi:hypothetical protein
LQDHHSHQERFTKRQLQWNLKKQTTLSGSAFFAHFSPAASHLNLGQKKSSAFYDYHHQALAMGNVRSCSWLTTFQAAPMLNCGGIFTLHASPK